MDSRDTALMRGAPQGSAEGTTARGGAADVGAAVPETPVRRDVFGNPVAMGGDLGAPGIPATSEIFDDTLELDGDRQGDGDAPDTLSSVGPDPSIAIAEEAASADGKEALTDDDNGTEIITPPEEPASAETAHAPAFDVTADASAPTAPVGQTHQASEAEAGVTAAATVPPGSAASRLPAEEMRHAGAMLAAAREAVGIDLQAVYQQTNIRPDQIAAIEAMNVKRLPAPTFTLGFVRAYAELVGLPAGAMTERFRRDAGYPEPQAVPKVAPRAGRDLTARQGVSLMTVILLVAAVLWLSWHVLQATAPEEVDPSGVSGVPLAERARSGDQDVMYQAGTDLEDDLVGEAMVPLPDVPSLGDTAVPERAPPEIGLPSGPIVIVEGGDMAIADPADTASAGRPAAVGTTADPAVPPAASTDRSSRPTDMPPAQRTAPPAPEPEPRQTVTEPPRAVEGGSPTDIAAGNAAATAALAQTPPPTSDELDTEELAAALASAERERGPTPADDLNTAALAAAIPRDSSPSSPARTSATLRLAVEPVYPARCEVGAAATETVTIVHGVSRYGKVTNPQVSATTNTCFDRAAIAAVSRWDFNPAMEDGAPTAEARRASRVTFTRP